MGRPAMSPMDALDRTAPSQLAVVHIHQTCNLRCVFCLERPERSGEASPDLAQVLESLASLRAGGATDVVFMGAETLLRPDAPEVLKSARELGFARIRVATNGTPVARRGYLAALVDAGLNALELSIHGATPDVADRIAGVPHTFARQALVLAQLATLPALELTINTVICRENAPQLSEIAAHVRQLLGPQRPVQFKFIFTHLLGSAWQHARNEGALRYADVDLVALGDRLTDSGVDFLLDNAPLCRLGSHAFRSLKLKSLVADETYWDRADHGNTYRPTGFQLSGQVWPASPCDQCTVRALCPGIEEQYARLVGAAELRPMTLDPRVLATQALGLHGANPARAPERLHALSHQPRPSAPIHPLRAGLIHFHHPDIAHVLELRVEPSQPERPCFKRTPRFDLAYRPWEHGNATADPRVRGALSRAFAALLAADAAGLALPEAKAQVAAQTGDGWAGQVG